MKKRFKFLLFIPLFSLLTACNRLNLDYFLINAEDISSINRIIFSSRFNKEVAPSTFLTLYEENKNDELPLTMKGHLSTIIKHENNLTIKELYFEYDLNDQDKPYLLVEYFMINSKDINKNNQFDSRYSLIKEYFNELDSTYLYEINNRYASKKEDDNNIDSKKDNELIKIDSNKIKEDINQVVKTNLTTLNDRNLNIDEIIDNYDILRLLKDETNNQYLLNFIPFINDNSLNSEFNYLYDSSLNLTFSYYNNQYLNPSLIIENSITSYKYNQNIIINDPAYITNLTFYSSSIASFSKDLLFINN